jgi:hypothetical protein
MKRNLRWARSKGLTPPEKSRFFLNVIVENWKNGQKCEKTAENVKNQPKLPKNCLLLHFLNIFSKNIKK